MLDLALADANIGPFMNVVLAMLAWVVWAWACRALLDNPRGDPITGLIVLGMKVVSRVVHRTRWEGLEHLPAAREAGPLIVVCNHTAGVDPLLVQSACRFEVRWMMAMDMQVPFLEPFWEFARLINVNRKARDTTSAREALRHLASGGVVGVFPEGGIEKPARTLRRFHPGVGLLVAKSGAKVLPVWISGTPVVRHAWESLWTPGRARVRFGPLMDFSGKSLDSARITAEIRAWYVRVSGWPDTP